MIDRSTDRDAARGLALEISGLWAYIRPRDPDQPIRALGVGTDEPPWHKPHLVLRVSDLVKNGTDDPDLTLVLPGERAPVSYAVWKLEGYEMTIGSDARSSAQPTYVEGSRTQGAEDYLSDIRIHVPDMARLVEHPRLDPRVLAADPELSFVGATLLLGGGADAEISGMKRLVGSGKYAFDPLPPMGRYEPDITDRVLYRLRSDNIRVRLRPFARNVKHLPERTILLKSASASGYGPALAALSNLPSSLATGTVHHHGGHGGEPPAGGDEHFLSFYRLLLSPPERKPLPKPRPGAGERDPESGTCPPVQMDNP
jgi:hypothetical protein